MVWELEDKMTLNRNKKGKYSDKLSRSKEDWERGRGAKKKGNPSYKPSTNMKGRKTYIVRSEAFNPIKTAETIGKKFKKNLR